MVLPVGLRTVEGIPVRVEADPSRAGAAAAEAAAAAIRAAIDTRGEARIQLASAPSQEELLAALVADESVDWSRVHAFHIDEYVGLPDGSPHSFGRWLCDRLSGVDLAAFHQMRPGTDPVAEARRYVDLLARGPIDLACLGIGVNGHIAFNEPGAATFDDRLDLRVVTLDGASRRQQVDEDLFGSVSEVPRQALTLTVPALLRAGTVVVTVHGRHKAAAVAAALTGPVGPACPASAVRTHPAASWYLDAAAASLLDL
jgi:glucosamine-6-phosphate deaminase